MEDDTQSSQFVPVEPPSSLIEAVRLKKGAVHNYLFIDENGTLKLKQNSAYYRQVQGQIHITERKWCKFVVYLKISGVFMDCHVQTINRDDNYWQIMEDRLVDFFHGSLLVEIIEQNG